MNNRSQKRQSLIVLLVFLSGMLLILFGLAVSIPVQPALAQTGYPVETATEPGYPVVTNTPGVTVTASSTVRVTITATATRAGTLPPPSVTGTPTVLFPVTGADLTTPGGQGPVGMWVALWIVGLLLIGFGLRSKVWKR
jgi:hypothetical protein